MEFARVHVADTAVLVVVRGLIDHHSGVVRVHQVVAVDDACPRCLEVDFVGVAYLPNDEEGHRLEAFEIFVLEVFAWVLRNPPWWP